MKKISVILREKRISQVSIAEKLEIHPQSFFRMLQSDDVKMSTLIKIAEALKMSIVELVAEIYEEQAPTNETHLKDEILEMRKTISNLSESLLNLTSKK